MLERLLHAPKELFDLVQRGVLRHTCICTEGATQSFHHGLSLHCPCPSSAACVTVRRAALQLSSPQPSFSERLHTLPAAAHTHMHTGALHGSKASSLPGAGMTMTSAQLRVSAEGLAASGSPADALYTIGPSPEVRPQAALPRAPACVHAAAALSSWPCRPQCAWW